MSSETSERHAAEAQGAEPSPCSSLRTKAMYLPPNAQADGRTEGGSATAAFWCLKTMKTTGPDDGFVARSVCVPDRTCYTSRD